jgi:hypothetical protein
MLDGIKEAVQKIAAGLPLRKLTRKQTFVLLIAILMLLGVKSALAVTLHPTGVAFLFCFLSFLVWAANKF